LVTLLKLKNKSFTITVQNGTNYNKCLSTSWQLQNYKYLIKKSSRVGRIVNDFLLSAPQT